MGKRAIVWAAVSSEEQAAGDKESLQYQERLGREAAARHGLDVVEVIRSDDSRSVIRLDVAMRNERLGYARLVEALERRQFDVLIYYDSDRLGRNRALAAQVQEECAAAGVALYDLRNPPQSISADVGDAQRILWSIQGAAAQNDVEKFKQRARFGRTARARKGMFMGSIPYGYTIDDAGRIAADPAPSAVIRRIFAAYLQGHGLPRIAADLNADNIPTPKGRAWQVGTLAYILNNVLRYAGWMEHNRYSRRWRDPYMRVRGQWPALIDDATAERVQAERAERAANRRLADTPHLLSGVVWCMDCERPMRISTVQSGKANRHAYLRCMQPAHPFRQVRADQLLEFVFEEMGRLAEVDIDRLLVAMAPATDPAAAIDAERRELDRLRKALQDADDAYYVRGRLDADRYERTVSRLQTEIANRQTALEQLQQQARQMADQGSRKDRLLDVLHNGADILRGADPTAANVWLRMHLRVWVKDKKPLIAEWL